MQVKMSDFGTSLAARGSGRKAYEAIVASTVGTPVVTFDFSGVDLVTNSFADEVFGRMAFEMGIDEMRKRTHFVNIPPIWAKVVRGAIDRRSSERDLALA